MSKVEFLGIYTARGDYRLPTLPVENESGLWQAWKTANGSFVVQPLDYKREPWGSHSIIAAGDFEESFSPLPSDEAIAMAGRGLLRSDSPDLMEFWFEQAQVLNSGKEGIMPGSALGQVKKRNASPSAASQEQEPQFSPLDEPDLPEERAAAPFDALLPREDVSASPPEPQAPVSRDEVLRLEIELPPPAPGPVDSWLASLGMPESLPSVEMPQEEAGSSMSPERERPAPPGGTLAEPDPLAEERAMILENSMYSEFNELTEQLDESPHPAVEAEVERLLRRGTGFTWRQKFMFSEFGMVLRRKKKFHLALQSHLRALALAPTDEHVLFNVARSEYDLGNLHDACDYLEKALISDPEFEVARNFLAFLSSRK